MKKLIEKLEVLKRVSPSLSDWGEGYTSGVMDALQIVKAHDPWISAEELPPFESEWSVMSEIVLLRDEDGEIYRGYFTLETNTYKTKSGFTINPTHWAYLPGIEK